jgi:thymidylate synthase
MNNIDIQYQKLLQDILDNGIEKKDRTGTGTISVFGRQIRHKMSEGFPLLTTKKMAWKTMVTELLWFLRGDTNIKFLVENGCHIWDGDAYKNYHLLMIGNEPEKILSLTDFIDKIKNDEKFANHWGDLGPIYGSQWRDWGSEVEFGQGESVLYGGVDQIANLINDLKTNPDSRRLMVNAWNVGELDQMVLPPCHYGFQVYTRELSLERRYNIWFNNNYETGMERLFDPNNLPDFDDPYYNPTPKRTISLMWNQRSVDTFLGLPFNIASYGLLLEIIAKVVNMVPDELIGNLGDVHLYSNHIEQAKEQIGRRYTFEEREEMLKNAMGPKGYRDALNDLAPFGGGMSDEIYKIPNRTRQPFQLPKLVHGKTDEFYKSLSESTSLFGHLNTEDFSVEGYQSHPSIKAPLSN